MRDSGAYRWFVVTVLMLGYLLAFLDRTMITLMVVPIKADLGLTDTEVSLLIGLAFVMLYSVAGVPLGIAADRYHRVRIIMVGATVWCFATAACGLAVGFWSLFAARVLVGLGEATLTPCANSLIGDYFPPQEMGRALGIFNFGLIAGAGLSLVLGSRLLGLADHVPKSGPLPFADIAAWRLVLIGLGLCGLMFVALLGTVREPARGSTALGKGWLSLAQLRRYFWVHRKLYGSLYLCQGLLTAITFAALSWMPTYFIRVHGWSAAEAGLSYGGATLAGSVAGLFSSGWLADRWRAAGRTGAAWRVMLLGLIAFVPGLFLAPLAPYPGVTLLLVALGVFGASFATICGPAIITLSTPNEARGVGSGLFYLSLNLLGAATGPTLVALLTDHLFSDPLAVGRSLVVVGGVCWFLAVVAGLVGAPEYSGRTRSLAAVPNNEALEACHE